MTPARTVQELADYIGGRVTGDPTAVISGLGTLDSAVDGQITFLANDRYASKVQSTRASAVVLSPAAQNFGRNSIVVDNPYLAFAKLLSLYSTKPRPVKGVMAGAFVGEQVTLGSEVSIYPGAYIGDRVRIGNRTTIHPNSTLYEGAVIGDDVTIHSGVSIREGCRIGDGVTIHNGAVIGGDGFGYVPDGDEWYKIPQIGIVIIEDNVEIGANTTVDRAALETTRIGRGTKIDNLVQVAHNCQIGENCIIVAQTGIAGSVRLGRHVTLGGQAAIVDHAVIGDNAMVSGQSGVFGNIAAGAIMSGSPAIPHQTRLKAAAVFPLLPEMRRNISRLTTRMTVVEKQLGQSHTGSD